MFIFILFFCCSGQKDKKLVNKNILTVSIPPQKYLVERIVGNDYLINVLIPENFNPHIFEPSLKQIKDLSNSEFYFIVGTLPIEKNLIERIKKINPDLKIINTSKNINFIKGEEHHHKDEQHNQSEEEEEVEPHIWLSPQCVKIMLENIYNSLLEINRDAEEKYKKNYLLFLSEINELENRIKKISEEKKNKKFVIYHPNLTYFAEHYKFEQISIEYEGKEPEIFKLKEIIDIARREEIKIIFVQIQFPKERAKSIANEIKGNVIEFNPLEYDWLKNMNLIVDVFDKYLK
ncbi:MAG TPA: zinc ABC transporter substrate-binding protein [bacterium]|nr:zinc ABC transporter substrate-binding protein [bacterium]